MRALFLAFAALVSPAALQADTPAAPTAQADPNAPQGKLPDVATPLAYRLDLTIVPARDRFSGHAEIDVALRHAAASLYMHGRDLHVIKATAAIAGKSFPVRFTQVTDTGAARVDFGRTLKPGKLTLTFDYDGAFGSNPSGLYHLKVGNDWYSWTQFESIDARSAFPSFDEPGYKTPFTVSLTTTPGFVALSNAPETGATPAGKLVRHRFAPTRPLPTYLMAFVVGPFATAEAMIPPSPERKAPLPLRIVATRDQAGKLDFALRESGRIVSLLERYFGRPFPFPKLDQIASPAMPGAMENAGADIYGDDILLLDAGATTAQKQNFGMIVAHELSHQWFGDLVTPAWWDDIWLNESFANWMGFRIGNEWRPDLNIGVNAIGEALNAMNTDSLRAGRPIHQHITEDKAIDGAFDEITYGKGGQVIAMIAAYLGDARFQAGVRLHMQRHAYGNASTDDFFASLADAAKDPRVLAAMRSFVDQQGVPVVSLHRESGRLIATQAPYAYFGADPGKQQWTIPLCMRQGAARTCSLLQGKSMEVAAPGTGALMPNADGTGYYRFDLDPADWSALIAAAPKLPAGEALAMSDSLWASFYAGKANMAELIAETRAIAGNPDSNAAIDGASWMSGLASRGMIPADAQAGYRKLMEEVYAPLYARLGFDPAAGAYAKDDPDRQKLRQAVVAGMAEEGRDAAVRERLLKAADAYLGGDGKALDQAFLGSALTVAVETRGLPFARTLADRALGSSDGVFRQAALGAITSTGNRDIAQWYLNEFRDPRLRGLERVSTVANLLGSTETRDMTFTYLIDNYDSYATGNGIFFTSRLPGLFRPLCSLEQADTLEKGLAPKVVAFGGALALERTVERVRNCAKIKAARTEEVGEALKALE